ncbi:hypothetical protein Maes01_02013 [Microbulbifer aestuariivivens]|uniref:Alpha/beta hydrolase n=1 Tax=Microbulbifer aestuariivivens TaxID=1908308 RepID=A0ABP9WT51_9GAMM
MKLQFNFVRRVALRTFAALLTIAAAPVYAASIDISANGGDVRVHYPENVSGSCKAVVLGVGTGMSIKGYDRLLKAISGYGHVAVIIDHESGNLTKKDANRYRNLAQEVKNNMSSWLAGRGTCTEISNWVMGGHSAGGQAAQNAIASTPGLADAVFSIDPYDATETARVSVPAMYWGFNVDTCFVGKEKAAAEAYRRSDSQRAFFRVDRKYSWGPCGYSPKYFHCSFCDNHCPACTNCMKTPSHFFVDVAASVDNFLKAVFSGNWSKSALSISGKTPVRLFVDAETP